MAEMTWRCRCGETEVAVTLGAGDRLTCYCKDCQGFARHLGAAEILDDLGGSDLYNTVPDRLRILCGADNLRVLRMTPKGPLRWYACCCKTPFANGLTKPGLPFATVILNPAVDVSSLGPAQIRVNVEGARGSVPKGGSGMIFFVLRLMRRALTARLARKHRQTPFFDAAGDPVAEVQLLTKDERRAALP